VLLADPRIDPNLADENGRTPLFPAATQVGRERKRE
jgi:hypothetical protein